MIKLAIFDLDGVITSTSNQHFDAWKHLFKQTFNVELNPQYETLTRGVSRMDSLNVLLKQYQIEIEPSLKDQLIQEKNEHYQSMIQTFNPSHIYPGIIDLLKALKQRGLLIALGSASKNGPKLLDLLELNHYFDYVVDPAPLLGKPNPDIFLDAMNHFHLTPEACIGFEDAEAGIEAINRAGMISIGVGTESLKEAKFKYSSIELIDSIELDKIIGK